MYRSVSDPYAYMASNIPTDLPSAALRHIRRSQAWLDLIGGTPWAGTKSLTGTASLVGNTLICGDLRLTGDVTIDAPSGSVLYIENGLLDLQGYAFRTASGPR